MNPLKHNGSIVKQIYKLIPRNLTPKEVVPDADAAIKYLLECHRYGVQPTVKE